MADDLRAKAVGGIKWGLLTSYAHRLIGFGSRFVLSWLLMPEDWGLVAAAMLVITIVRSCGNFGINYAMVHRRERVAEAARTALVLLFGINAVAYLLVTALSPFTKAYFSNAAVPFLTRVLALSLLLRPPAVVVEGTLRREFRLRRIFVMGALSHAVAAAAAIAVALLLPREHRYWALVVGGLSREALHSLLAWWAANVPLRLEFNRQVAKELIDYGKHFVGMSVLMMVYLNLDRMVLGRVGSTLALGLYAFAFDWVNQLGFISEQIFGGVSIPLYARLQADCPRLRTAYCRILGYTALVSVGLLTGMVCLVPDAVRLALPERYRLAILTFQCLGCFFIVRSVDTTTGQLYAAIGVPKYNMYLAAVNLAVMAIIMVPLVRLGGPAGAALAVAFARLVTMLANARFCKRQLSCRYVDFLDSLMPAVTAGAVMAGALWAVKLGIARAGLAVGWVMLGGLIAFGALVYIGVVYATRRALFLEVLGLIRDALVPQRKDAHAS